MRAARAEWRVRSPAAGDRCLGPKSERVDRRTRDACLGRPMSLLCQAFGGVCGDRGACAGFWRSRSCAVRPVRPCWAVAGAVFRGLCRERRVVSPFAALGRGGSTDPSGDIGRRSRRGGCDGWSACRDRHAVRALAGLSQAGHGVGCGFDGDGLDWVGPGGDGRLDWRRFRCHRGSKESPDAAGEVALEGAECFLA